MFSYYSNYEKILKFLILSCLEKKIYIKLKIINILYIHINYLNKKKSKVSN